MSSSAIDPSAVPLLSPSVSPAATGDRDSSQQDYLKLPLNIDDSHDGRVLQSQSLASLGRLGGQSLYEKKCTLVNREIDAMGMGKYQWCIWTLCGFGYLLDLLWAMAFGLVLGPLQQEFGFPGSDTGNISIAFSAGMTAGAAIWGILVDIVGRKWAFNLTCLCSTIFGLALGFSHSYTTFLILTAFVGFGVGGNIPIDTTITLEFIPQRNRRLLPFLSIFQPIGVVITTALAYGFIPTYSCTPNFSQSNPLASCADPMYKGLAPPQCCGQSNNMGWRYLLFCVGGITLTAFVGRFVVFTFRESPKFLVYRGHDDKAVKVLQQISVFNKRECGVTLAHFETLEAEHNAVYGEAETLGGGAKQLKATWKKKTSLELQRYKLLFSSFTMARMTILVFLTYFFDYFGFTVAGTYLPIALAKKNGDLNLSLEFSYRSYIIIYTPGITGVLLGVLCYDLPNFGRKWTMVVSSGLMGLSIMIFASINTEASNIGVNVLEYFFQSMFNAVLYGWTPEVFPAPVRGSACGLASFCGRLAGIISPLIAQNLLPTDANTPGDAYNRLLYLAGGVTLGCVLTTALLPSEKVGSESM